MPRQSHALASLPVIEGDSQFAHDVIAGLTARPKTLPPKYFYDETGAQLFEAITATPEYYPTRCEMEILRERAGEIAQFIPQGCAMIEFGSGSSRKARLLLAAAPPPTHHEQTPHYPPPTPALSDPHRRRGCAIYGLTGGQGEQGEGGEPTPPPDRPHRAPPLLPPSLTGARPSCPRNHPRDNRPTP
jgi:hypothetical protein